MQTVTRLAAQASSFAKSSWARLYHATQFRYTPPEDSKSIIALQYFRTCLILDQ